MQRLGPASWRVVVLQGCSILLTLIRHAGLGTHAACVAGALKEQEFTLLVSSLPSLFAPLQSAGPLEHGTSTNNMPDIMSMSENAL